MKQANYGMPDYIEQVMRARNKFKVPCNRCGRKAVMPVQVPRLVCKWCGYYVFSDKQEEFKYRLSGKLKEVNKC